MPPTIFNSLRHMAIIQAVIVLVVGGLLWLSGRPQLAASFAVGASLMLGNLMALAWSTWRVLAKKPVASTVLIIVIKYALLLGSVFYFARMPWFSSAGAGLGIASFMLAILGSAMVAPKVSDDEVDP
jgi:hypothetical protein